MAKAGRLGALAAAAAFCLFSALAASSSAQSPGVTRREVSYTPSAGCYCHGNILEQHMRSEHEKSFTNPIFQAQYFTELLPRSAENPALIEEGKLCIACHAPIAYKMKGGHITKREQVDQKMSGVTCDFCHTITGYMGNVPGNGNHLSEPSATKLGPLETKTTWHHAYSVLQTKSEFCAICHNAVNHHGLEVKSTFTEWKDSRYAKEGIQCQDCHMTVYGFLTGGKPTYDLGQAANISMVQVPQRSKLYTHRFQGAHSKTQVTGSLALAISAEKSTASLGEGITLRVRVDNERTGHKMPSGSADLRLLWLSLKASYGSTAIAIPANSSKFGTHGILDVAGRGPQDQEILGQDIPQGSRIYRAIFVDGSGKQTLSSYNAVKIVFDNRLQAGEIREEIYHFTVPAGAGGIITLQASLHYLPYPSSFTNSFGLAKSESVEIAIAKKEITVH